MEINVRDDAKTVEIWLTCAENRDSALLEALRPIYALCGERRYRTAVFKSGGGNLFAGTRELLLHNRAREL